MCVSADIRGVESKLSDVGRLRERGHSAVAGHTLDTARTPSEFLTPVDRGATFIGVVAKPTPKRATYADLEALPPYVVGEILFGVLYVNPRPAMPHARVASKLGAVLDGPFDNGREGPGGWIILDEPELHLGSEPDVLVPDLAGWRQARMPHVPAAPFTKLAPDWVCEILSASTEASDRGEKMTIYARERVSHAWLVDPAIRTLEVFRLDGETWRMLKTWHGNVTVNAEPFDAIALDLAALWERLPPSTP